MPRRREGEAVIVAAARTPIGRAGRDSAQGRAGASAVITSDRVARDLDLQPLARIVTTGVSALEPVTGMGQLEAP